MLHINYSLEYYIYIYIIYIDTLKGIGLFNPIPFKVYIYIYIYIRLIIYFSSTHVSSFLLFLQEVIMVDDNVTFDL